MIGRLSEPAAIRAWDRALLHGELFSIERLEEHARSLAAAQPVAAGRSRGHQLADRLAVNAAFLVQANRAIAETVSNGHHTTPAAEWLADNYHLVDMQIREIGIDLPAGFYAQLPKLDAGPFKGLPRVFGAAWSLVVHTDSHFDPEALRRYLLAYQSVQPLPPIGPDVSAAAESEHIVHDNHLLMMAGAEGQFVVENEPYPGSPKRAAVCEREKMLRRRDRHARVPAQDPNVHIGLRCRDVLEEIADPVSLVTGAVWDRVREMSAARTPS